MKARRVLTLLAALAGLAAPNAARAQSEDLLGAYKKEFAFLEADKGALTERLEAVRRDSRREIGQAEGTVAGLQRRILEARAEADRLELLEQELAREQGGASDDAEVLGDTIERAHSALVEAGMTLPAIPDDVAGKVALIVPIAEAAAARIKSAGSLRREPGTFFLQDGTQVEGTVLHIGEVAALGASDAGAGALAPAGGGRLALWPRESARTARALIEGERPETLALVLYDNVERAMEPPVEKTARDIVESGGVIAWVIVALGALAALLVLFRLLILGWVALGMRRRFLGRIERLVREDRANEAAALCARRRGAGPRVLGTLLRHLDRDRETVEDLVAEAVLAETPRVERFGAALGVFAAVAPLLGLLGTVTGMISTFDIITEHGTGDPKLLSGGISEALVTTELGLMVAIPALLLGTLLSGQANGLLGRLERMALRILNIVHTREPAGADLGAGDARLPRAPEESCSKTPSLSSEATSIAAAS
ncbi:MAG: MotA/TolQ/ExbB proton channel family protein [Deltaproteobacteria bacterium]|nr:MotA/TolQ/ExbB proton channel family protein [Deltaproteobacteria bacterium]MCB9785529.1 MotA/TolQ/ExbB proton channel family protein [Deltaproteobacteria bacterium]